MKSILSAVIGATLALSAIEAGAQATPGERQVSLTIESSSLATALDKWAQQSGFQIFVQDWEATKNLRAPSLNGTFAAQDALNQLLSGTSLTYVWIDSKTVSIRKKVAQTVPTALQRTSLEGQQMSRAMLIDDQPSTSGTAHAASPSDSDTGLVPNATNIEEVFVTGTFFRGTAPVGSPLRTYSREEISRSGASTIEQFARQMTENFSNADPTANANSSASIYGTPGIANVFGGATFNLHGVGATATLTLLNGNRIAAAGERGDRVDISQIPLSAIERVEVMTDGASSIYGADAVAGVVNIITRDDFEGAETSLRYGGLDSDGGNQLSASQLLGTAWDTGNAMVSYEHSKQDELDASDRDFLPHQGGAYSLIPENRRNSVVVAGSQSFGSSTKLGGNALYSDRDVLSRVHLGSSFGTTDVLSQGTVKTSGLSLSLDRELPNSWLASLRGNYSRMEQSLSDSGTSTFFTSLATRDVDSDVVGGDLLASGPLAQLSAGELRVALGISSRQESFGSLSTSALTIPGLGTFTDSVHVADVSRRVDSAYAEVLVPLLASHNSSRRLELSASVRYDDYSDFGSSTNSKFGIGWTALDGLRFRASYGTSFRAPLLVETRPPVESSVAFRADASSPSGAISVLTVAGGNPDLQPEESDSWTAGLDWQPPSVPGLTIGASYFELDFRNRIAFPPITGDPLTDPLGAHFVTRDPPLADVQAYFDSPGFRGDDTGLGPDAVEAIYDARQSNITSTRQSGVDLTTIYGWTTDPGRLDFSLSASRLFENEYRLVAGAPTINLLNRFAQPLEWKGRGGIAWSQGGFNAAAFVNYANSYTNGLGARIGVPGSAQQIDAWTTFDLITTYVFQSESQLHGLSMSLSVINITDEEPPFVEIPASLTLPEQNVLPFDATNASPLGRYISLQLSKQW
jgi:iron complex outermembrane recepter protein